MALSAALAEIMFVPDGEDPSATLLGDASRGLADTRDLAIVPLFGGGPPLRCHLALLRARCRELPEPSLGHNTPSAESTVCEGSTSSAHCADAVLEVEAEWATVFALMRWIYCEALDDDVVIGSHVTESRAGAATALGGAQTPQRGVLAGFAAVRLARRWGLRDVGYMQSRLAARRLTERAPGTLREDVLRAYDSGAFSGSISFRACVDEDDTADACVELLPGGWPELLRARSAYFRAMLGGHWAETSGAGASSPPACTVHTASNVVNVHWPRRSLARLLRFVHGADFVVRAEDLHEAVECATFFGVPSLLASVSDWIAANLKVANASALWNFVEESPALSFGAEDAADADDACFDFHVRHFRALGLEEEGQDKDGAAARPPIYDLHPSLMQRLLSSGLVDVPTQELTLAVKRYAKACTRSRPYEEYADLRNALRPPVVLFNRENRSRLLPTTAELLARNFVFA